MRPLRGSLPCPLQSEAFFDLLMQHSWRFVMRCPFPIPLCLAAVGIIALGFLVFGGKKKTAS